MDSLNRVLSTAALLFFNPYRAPAREVIEQPVKETVHLREEHVQAERRPADRVLSGEEAEQAFQDRTVEMTETTEEVAA